MSNQQTIPEVVAALKKMHACGEAIRWLKQQPSWSWAWRACPRGDWMEWLLYRLAGKPGSVRHSKYQVASRDAYEAAKAAHAAFRITSYAEYDAALDACHATEADVIRWYYPTPPRLPEHGGSTNGTDDD